jgi:uncharacterized membrane protein YbaN (DUF454 family)
MTRYIALVFAYFFLIIAMIGVVVPGLPTVPFLLLAAWFSAKGSKRLHSWLYQHPRFGRLLIDWESHRAISRKSKVIAVLMLVVSWVVMYLNLENAWGVIAMSFLFASVAIFLVTRPEPD